MLRKDREVVDLQKMYEVISKARICRMAMTDGEQPYLLPMSFGFDGEFLWFHCANKGLKLDILQKNPRVCMEFEQDVEEVLEGPPNRWTFNFFTVICQGRAEIVKDLEIKRYGLNVLVRQYVPEVEPDQFTENQLVNTVIFRVKPEGLTGKLSKKV